MFRPSAFAALAMFVVSAHATPFTVTNTADSGTGSLRDAIAQANASLSPPSTIVFDPSVTGTILLTTGQIQISSSMSIVGPGSGVLTIDGNANGRIFSIFATDPACPSLDGPLLDVSISGLHLTNARRTTSNGAGAIFTEHSLSLDSVIIDNSVAGNGGGVTFDIQYPGQTLTINNSQFLNNKNQPLFGPTNTFGGAVALFEKCSTHTTPVTFTITNSLFSGNQSLPTTLSGFGGAIGSDSSADITISNSRIVGNSVIAPNPPPANQIYRGGGMHVHAKSLTIVDSEISNNAITDVTGADVSRGGGMQLYNNASDLQDAGDLFNAKIINSTISGNSSPATAGAIFVYGNVALELDNATVDANQAPSARTGGIVISTGATSPPSASNATTPTMTMVSSILANSAGADLATSVATIPTFTVNATDSLIQNICPSPTCVITVSGSGNLIATDPMVGPLAFNGGPTQTHALLSGSPAINAGSNPLALTTDQRGAPFARVVGPAADMGAYEFVAVTAPVLQSAVSRKVHGSAGTFNLPLSLVVPPAVNHNPTTEPRQGPAQTIVFTFDKAISGATATITEGTATAGTPTFSGNDVIVPLTGVTDKQYVTVTLSGVASTDGGSGGTGVARVGFLLADVNQNRVVTVSDIVLVNQQIAHVVTSANFLKDVNANGILTVSDKLITNNNVTHALPAP